MRRPGEGCGRGARPGTPTQNRDRDPRRRPDSGLRRRLRPQTQPGLWKPTQTETPDPAQILDSGPNPWPSPRPNADPWSRPQTRPRLRIPPQTPDPPLTPDPDPKPWPRPRTPDPDPNPRRRLRTPVPGPDHPPPPPPRAPLGLKPQLRVTRFSCLWESRREAVNVFLLLCSPCSPECLVTKPAVPIKPVFLLYLQCLATCGS